MKDIKKIAIERIENLFSLAEKNAKSSPELSKRYVGLARKIAMRVPMRIPKEHRRTFCKECGIYWIPGYNCTVRTRPGQAAVIVTCKCGKVKRWPYKREKKSR